MKEFINKNSKQIELIISIIGLILTCITLTHNIHILNVVTSLDTFQVNYQSSKIHSIELILFFIPLKYRKITVHFYHKHFCKLAWCNFLFFMVGTIYTNLLLGYSLLHNIGLVALLELIVLALEKNPVDKLNKVIDLLSSIFR